MRRLFAIVTGGCLLAVAFAYGCSDDAAPAKNLLADAGDDRGTVGDDPGPTTDSGNDTGALIKARATLAATGLPDAGTPSGTLEIEDNGTQATVTINVSGATPGDHGVHIHAVGDCSNVDGGYAAAAGGHWNPTDAGHGFPTSPTHHAGDLGNVTVAAGGAGSSTVMTSTIKLATGDPLNPIGKAVIFHQGSDDGVSQPTGDAGTRAACGIIEKL
jgi:Cu-Zn family superoxide dismutase